MSNENTLLKSHHHFHFIVLTSTQKGLEDVCAGQVVKNTADIDDISSTGNGKAALNQAGRKTSR